jgi:hypothetical protein
MEEDPYCGKAQDSGLGVKAASNASPATSKAVTTVFESDVSLLVQSTLKFLDFAYRSYKTTDGEQREEAAVEKFNKAR